ncbi:hypothetical protein HDG35_007296 [Paraburkholderia sp. JPY681]|nr:hypothetical protein [Paraburkholderia atlantica]
MSQTMDALNHAALHRALLAPVSRLTGLTRKAQEKRIAFGLTAAGNCGICLRRNCLSNHQSSMARTIPFYTSPQAVRARRSKTLLLPMPRAQADELSLQVHIALDAMRRGQGTLNAAQTLCQAMIVVGLLAEAGYGSATVEQMQDAEEVIGSAFDRGRDTGVWMLDDDGFAQFATIVSTYDDQLRRAPVAVIADASDRLDRFRAGETFEQTARRRA